MGQFIQAFQYQILEETKIENDMNEIDGLEFSIHKESDNDSPNLFFNSNQAALNLGSQTHRPSNSSKPPLLVNKSKNKQKLQKQTSRQRQPSQRNTSNSQTRSDQGIKSNKQNLKQLQQIRSLLVQSNKFSKFEDLYNRGTQSTLRKQKDYDSQTSTTQCTFKPEIDPVSKLLATSHSQFNSSKLSQSVQINDLHSSLYLKGKMLIEEKQKKISDIQKKRNKSIKQECTFQPNSHKYKYLHDRLPNNSIVMTEHKSNMDQFYDKNRLWEDEKQQRLLQERERKRQMEMDECLFQPNIRERENSKSPFTSQRYSSINGAQSIQNYTWVAGFIIVKSNHLKESKLQPLKYKKEYLKELNKKQSKQKCNTIGQQQIQ
eukprot:403331434